MRRRLLLFVFLFTLPAALAAQAPTPDTATSVVKHVPAKTAFIRSLLVPGWGQFSVHANTRGAVFVALQGTSWYMLVKTLNKLSDAQKVADTYYRTASDSLRAKMAKDTALAHKYDTDAKFAAQVKLDSAYVSANSLVNSRRQQRQDWITYTLFTTLASGVDAYVAAQLADWPATVSAQPRAEGGMQFRVTVPFRKRQ